MSKFLVSAVIVVAGLGLYNMIFSGPSALDICQSNGGSYESCFQSVNR